MATVVRGRITAAAAPTYRSSVLDVTKMDGIEGVFSKLAASLGEMVDNVEALRPFVSAQQTGTGAPQSIAHGLGKVPTKIVIVPENTGSYGVAWTITEGAHTTVNLIITATTGLPYKVIAWR